MARIILASYVIRLPLGGFQSWVLQWLLGFHRSGHEVYLLEKSGWPNSCFDPSSGLMGDDCSYGTAAFRDLLTRFGLEDRWCFVDSAELYHGLSRESVRELFKTADLYIDHMRECEWLEESAGVRLRVMVDLEPSFTQMQMEKKLESEQLLPEFDYYHSVGLNIGSNRSTAPTAGKIWHPILNPVVVDLYRPQPVRQDAPFTTVMNWQSQDPIEYKGTTYGMIDIEFQKFLELPARTEAPFVLAVAGRNTLRERLRQCGWGLRDTLEVSKSYDSYWDYIRSSKGEFSVCKNYFVATNSGWFSDRSAAYLASGRPVVMQETGFRSHLPCGRGLFAVRDIGEAVAATEDIQGDQERHSKWARAIAMGYLDAERVLNRFLNELGL